MKVVPLGDKVVVRRLEAKEVTAGGSVLPDSARDKPQQGRVLAVGDGALLPDGRRAEQQVNEGDRVLFASFSGTEVAINDDNLLIMRESDILAVLE